ncbi:MULTISPECIES: hypothetical protein [unclassified Cedecea]|uniref:hypothetical protein n=1 Tax=unclassified Cedecea TaxID=2649846 RepID=UPI003018A7A6
MNNLSQRLAALMQDDSVPMSDDWGKLFNDLKQADCDLDELLALREAGKEPVGFRWRHESHHHDNAWSYVTHRTMPDAFESQQVVQYLYAAPQLPAVPEGWVMVPTEATSAMLNAAWISHGIHHPSAWRTMIGAAPKPEA